MKKFSYLMIIVLISSLVLAGCSLLSNVGQVPTTEQSVLSRNGSPITYDDVTLTGGSQAGHFPEIWDLTACDMIISFTYNANGLVDDAGAHAWAELGIRQLGYGDFNPTWQVEGAGVWLATDYEWSVNTFDPDPVGAPNLDLDDKLILQKAGGHGEGDYNLPSAPPAPGNNHRVWWDRDGVNPWQSGATANTNGIYNVVIKLHATTVTSGTAYMTIKGLDQGFETDGNWNTIELTPAGMTFTGDMTKMQVFYGLYGYGATHSVTFEDITVEGCLAILPSVPTITWPANGVYITTAALTHIDWTDSTGTFTPFEYKYEAYGDANYTSLIYSSGWLNVSEIQSPGTPEDVYYIRVMAKDSIGNLSDWSNGSANPYIIYKITVDNTPPVITAGTPTGIIGLNDWWTSDVTVPFSATDNLSGFAPDGVLSIDLASKTTVGEGVALNVTSDGISDRAGNLAVGIQAGPFKVDLTPPMVIVTLPNSGVYLLNQVVSATWSATDAHSGVVPPTTGTILINTSSVGTGQTLTVPVGTAVDYAGNPSAVVTANYSVVYAYSDILPPINPDGSSIFKLGSTVPVKFQLRDANGTFVPNAIAKIYLLKISNGITGTELEAVSTSAATTGNLFRYDSTSNQYIFNLATKPLSTGTWQIRIELVDDGMSYIVKIGLK